MRDHGSWSILVGRWAGVEIRLHMFFILFAASALLLGWQLSRQPGSADMTVLAAISILVLLVSGLLHEFGHVQSAMRLGGQADRIVLGPFAGLSSPSFPGDPRAEMVCHLAGPLVNVLICLACLPAIWLQDDPQVARLLNPFSPDAIAGRLSFLAIVRLTFWINWVTLLVNLLPVYPFDGGRFLRSAIATLRPDLGTRRVARVVAIMAKCVAFGLAIAACLFWRQTDQHLVPVWFALALLAILVYFSARHEESRAIVAALESESLVEFGSDGDEWGYDEAHDETSPSTGPGPVSRWLEQRRQQRLERQRVQEAEEERRVDEILQRLHAHGMESLNEEDRLVLNRVSARYRSRQGNHTS